MLRHLVAEISRFKFDDYRVIRTRAGDLNLFWGGVFGATDLNLVTTHSNIEMILKTKMMGDMVHCLCSYNTSRNSLAFATEKMVSK